MPVRNSDEETRVKAREEIAFGPSEDEMRRVLVEHDVEQHRQTDGVGGAENPRLAVKAAPLLLGMGPAQDLDVHRAARLAIDAAVQRASAIGEHGLAELVSFLHVRSLVPSERLLATGPTMRAWA